MLPYTNYPPRVSNPKFKLQNLSSESNVQNLKFIKLYILYAIRRMWCPFSPIFDRKEVTITDHESFDIEKLTFRQLSSPWFPLLDSLRTMPKGFRVIRVPLVNNNYCYEFRGYNGSFRVLNISQPNFVPHGRCLSSSIRSVFDTWGRVEHVEQIWRAVISDIRKINGTWKRRKLKECVYFTFKRTEINENELIVRLQN